VRLRHGELDVIDHHLALRSRKSSPDSLHGSIETLSARAAADTVLQRILRGNYKVYTVKTLFPDHVPDDGKMTDVKRVE
jgi:hypothetical protein